MSTSTLRSSRTVQLTFVLLLLTCFSQVAWWIVDQGIYSGRHMESVLQGHADRASAAELMLEDGLSLDEVARYFPDLIVTTNPGGGTTIKIADSVVAGLKEDRHARMARYGWEGSFFLLVLIATVSLIGVTLHQRTDLLRRQQNFLAAVSHELKSPLASLQLSAETFLMRDPDAQGRKRIAERMVAETERLGSMVTNLLDAARLDEDGVELVSEELCLREVVARTIEPISCMGHVQGVEIVNDIPQDLIILADAAAVQSIVGNIVSNAYKSVHAKGGGSVRLTAAKEGSGRECRVAMKVEDEGIGFDPKLAKRLFDKFFRPGSELTRKTKGAGLGLHIVKQLADLDDARITIESPGEGHGATFTVSWRHSENFEPSSAKSNMPNQEMMG